MTTSSILAQPPARSFSLGDLDTPLRWGWGVASVAILVTLAVAAVRLVSLRRRWRRATVEGRSVLVSRNVGPAVIGVWSPHVVLPEWALALSDAEREMMLAHEEQHVRAADPALLACGFALVLLAPWNLALWWQWRRLRLAVEMDCDARVLSQGRSAAAYGELLLDVGRRRTPQLLGAAAFGEPASFLESRIRRMLTGTPRWRWAGAAAAVVVAVGAMVGACETPRPVGPAEPVEAPAESARGITGIVSEVIAPTDIDQAPAVLSDATTYYPDLPRLAGVAGRVVVRASIEANGRADPSSVTVVQSSHPALAQAAKSAVLRALFRPAQAHGQAVGAVVHVVYDFMIPSSPIQQRRREVMDRHEPQAGIEQSQSAIQARLAQSQRALDAQMRELNAQAEQVRRLARRYHPEVYRRSGSPTAVALVMDSNGRVLAHAAKDGEARRADGFLYSGEDCRTVLERLVPRYKNTKWSVSGCAGDTQQTNVVVYWGVPLIPLTR